MQLIERDELKEKLARGNDFKLIMVLGDWAYRSKHIPGSLNFASVEDMHHLAKDDEIVVYCSDPNCIASRSAYQMLSAHGYTSVWRYAGGLNDWEEAGYALEGTDVETYHHLVP